MPITTSHIAIAKMSWMPDASEKRRPRPSVFGDRPHAASIPGDPP